ncbi:MAG: tetratricopeptide repeat protein [Planctomycetes bacterium]|nr:tetratricopeptide repeat protein [Planctomycetota bacterium]
MTRLVASLAALAVALAGCGGAEPGTEPAAKVTFAAHVAPLVYRSCAPCHHDGGPAPFSLCSFDDVYKRRRQLVEVTAERLMPPWLPTHGDFVGDRRLTDEQIARLATWVETGAARGDEAAEPPAPRFASGWQLREPDVVVELPDTIEVPADGPEVFRNFVVAIPATADRYVGAVEIRPGSNAVHHAVLAVDSTGAARRRDAADPGPGFAGMDMAGALPPDGYFLGWTPGRAPRELPPEMGFALPPGGDLVLQLHLTPTGKRETFRPRIGLYLRDTAPTAVSFPLLLFAASIDLPAGADDVVVTDHVDLPVAVEVHSVYPHAHYLCTSMRASATLPGGERRVLFEIADWDFDWQDDYLFAEPVALPAGSRVEFAYRYDNSADNPDNPSRPPVRVRLGDRSTDEMANLTMQVTVADHDARRRLGEAAARRALEKRPDDHDKRVELAVLLREQRRLDEAIAELAAVREHAPDHPLALCELGNCHLAAGRTTEAEQAYARCAQQNPDHDHALVLLGSLLLRTGRYDDAARMLGEAARRQPGSAAVHGNLATAYLALNQLPLAERHYRLAIQRDPQQFQAWFNLGRILAATGRSDDARAALERARALRPADVRVQQALQQLAK